jgi:hypothetical protein
MGGRGASLSDGKRLENKEYEMATAGISENRVYTDQPAAPVAEPFKVRARLTTFELLALAAVIGVCFSVIAFEYGYRRPARAAAEAAAQARQVARATPQQPAPRTLDVVPAPVLPQSVERSQPITPMADPTSIASSSIAAPPAPAAERAARVDGPARADDPFQMPGTIYRCRRYDGSVFWSSLHCAKHRGALIERIARVPADLPFEAQVRIASDEARRFEASLRAEQAELQRMNTCATLVGEQAQILRRAGDATVLAQVQATDRARAREIDAAMQRLRCIS